jgi:GNAT superfamily N-acetyltransferase
LISIFYKKNIIDQLYILIPGGKMLEFLQLELSDIEEFMQAKVDAFAEDVVIYGFGPSGYDSIDSLKNAMEKYHIYKMVLDGDIVGGISCYDQGNDEYWIGGIYVKRACQNIGIGAKAMLFIEAEFPQAKVWRLDTPYKSYRNHYFYEKLGYRKIGETEPDQEKEGFYLFLYEKQM